MSTQTEEGAAASIEVACRELKLPTVRSEASTIADGALRSGLTHRAFLAEVLAAEVDDRAERRRARRVADAKFPRLKRLDEFDCDRSPVTAATVASLQAGSFIDHGDPIVFLGDSGTGKSHLLIGTGLAAAEAGWRVRYTTAAGLVNELVEAADERTLLRVIARYSRVDLLCLDELGYLTLDTRGAELLFQILTDREEKRSVAVASNAPFSEWGRTFTDPRLAGAVVDRLTFRSLIIETGSDSYRLYSSTVATTQSQAKLTRGVS